MIAAAKAHVAQLCVNHNLLFDPVIVKARRLVDQGLVGTVIGLESYYGFNLAQTSERQWVAGLPGGQFQNLAPHPLSLILHFLHDPLELQVSSLTTGMLGRHVADELRVLIKGRETLGTLSISLALVRRVGETRRRSRPSGRPLATRHRKEARQCDSWSW